MLEEKESPHAEMGECNWTCPERRGRTSRRRPLSHKAVTNPANSRLGDRGGTFHFVASCKHSKGGRTYYGLESNALVHIIHLDRRFLQAIMCFSSVLRCFW